LLYVVIMESNVPASCPACIIVAVAGETMPGEPRVFMIPGG
jgi:hypothetical protein